MVTGWRRDSVCFQPRTYSRHRGILANEGARGRGSSGDSLRGNQLEGAAGFLAGRFADRLQLVSWAKLAPALDHAGEWRRCVSDFLRRLGRNQCAMVARRKAVGLYFEPQWKYGIVAADDSRRSSTTTGNGEAALSESAGSLACESARIERANHSGTSVPYRRCRALLRTLECVDPCGRWLRPR